MGPTRRRSEIRRPKSSLSSHRRPSSFLHPLPSPSFFPSPSSYPSPPSYSLLQLNYNLMDDYAEPSALALPSFYNLNPRAVLLRRAPFGRASRLRSFPHSFPLRRPRRNLHTLLHTPGCLPLLSTRLHPRSPACPSSSPLRRATRTGRSRTQALSTLKATEATSMIG
ncbi:hypothetical protein BCR35DRAFT_224285 [Leucosporidium creatinivorum]|uniref:Uncharacterized protein n=1 Tax=Leucosporidium creatinivorum TaxID=106004 RepID=A0A1Y2D8A1_9BASI|nr:hypothetical protein BCR35DRAFT_224285 [Leucosporidium creatinivorum]